MAEKKTSNAGPAILERRFVPAGAVIVRQGEPGTCAFLIQSGTVKVTTESGGRSVELAQISTGQIFGEMALMFEAPRVATVEALEDCNLIVITRQTLRDKLAKSDPTVRAIVPMLMKRIIQANNVVMNRQSNIDDLVETVNAIYQNIHAGLPNPQQKRSLENAVLPKLEELLGALKDFQARYNESE